MQKSSESAGSVSEPLRVWLVEGEKLGDNAQVYALMDELGWAFEEKKIFMKPEWVVGKPRVRPTLDHVDLGRSHTLEGPWPDLVITSGRRLSCVGLWIKRASGRRTKLVLLGKPRRMVEEFDLAVVATHFLVPDVPNVLRHDLPLMRVDPARIEEAAGRWRDELDSMARPITALLVGGPTGALHFDLTVARDLLAKTLAEVEASGGSLYVTTSPRTTPEVIELIQEEVPPGMRVFVFDPESGSGENPYHALLGLADRFVVTSDSVSMMVEVARLDVSLAIYPLAVEVGRPERWLTRLGWLRSLSPRRDPQLAGGLRARLMSRIGWPIHSRDLSAIPRRLVESGRASWLGDPPVPARPWPDDEIGTIADHVRELVGL